MRSLFSSSCIYTRGVVWGRPLFAPFEVSSTMGAPSKGGPTLPALPRNSSMILWLKLLTIGLPPCDRFYGSRVQMMISHGPESRDPRGSCATRFLHSVLPGRTPVG